MTAAEKIRTLHLLKKLTIQIVRQPDPEHYKAYQDEYEELFDSIQEEQERHNPVKWLEAELEYFNNINKKLTVEEVTNELNVMQAAKERLSKAWLTKDEMMQLFDISKSTLNRRIAEGMPAHKKGKAVHFYLQEVNEWMKDEKAA
ncbi:MAG: DNA-binding protein [Sphingobacteriales bacterium]|nr:MAG: DNA-binding protein [Sphingobacteriales bacterium]